LCLLMPFCIFLGFGDFALIVSRICLVAFWS
jgi:hypothetical protein